MSNIALKELTPAFITDFDMFLRVDKHCRNNNGKINGRVIANDLF